MSRVQYLDRVIDSLTKQTVQPNNLVVVFDGSDNEYLYVRNKVVGLKYESVLCTPSTNLAPAQTIPDRRRHIANIHNQLRELIENCDLIFSIEDDGVLPPDALEKLLQTANANADFGMITGVELGRWGTPYVGAWKVDDVFDTRSISSMVNKSTIGGIEEIDACGLYCSLIRSDLYKDHNFTSSNGLGPDVNLGLYLRQCGFKNYIDWSLHITHLTFYEGDDIEIKPTSASKEVTLTLLSGSTWKY